MSNLKISRKFLFYLISFFLFLVFVVSLDFLLGFLTHITEIRKSAFKFRSEVTYLKLNTRHILPNVRHRYPVISREDPFFDGKINGPRFFRTNKLGEIVGKNFSNINLESTRILFLGGSTTETNEVDEQYRFPWLVGKILSQNLQKPFRGINLGVRGNTSQDSINLLINHPSVKKINYAVLMNNINDRLFLSLKGSYKTPLYAPKNASLAKLIAHTKSFGFSLWNFMYFRSNFLFLINEKFININPWTGEKNKKFINERNINFENINFKEHLKEFEKNFEIFIAISRYKNIKPILMTQPLGIKSKEQDIFNQAIRNVAKEKKTLLIDLASEFSLERKELFLKDHIHLSNIGSRKVAEIVSRKISQSFFKKRKKSNSFKKYFHANFNSCLSAPIKGQKIKPGPKKLLLSKSGRYPVVSQNNRFVSFQSWDGQKEVINLYDFKYRKYEKLSNDNSNNSNRHAVILGNNKNDMEIIFASKKTDFKEVLKSINLTERKVKKILDFDQLSISIPFVNSKKEIFFAGSQLNSYGKPTEAPDLYRVHIDKQKIERLTKTIWEEWRPVLSPDKNFVYYISNEKGNFDIFRLNLKTRKKNFVFGTKSDEWDPHISQNGKWMVFASKKNQNWDLYMMSLRDKSIIIRLTSALSDEWDPRFISNSKAIVFASKVNKDSPPYIFYICLFGEKT